MRAMDDDWQLMARAEGDASALAMLFERHRHFVYRLAWGLLNEDQAADDVVQEVFARIAGGRLRAKPRARFTTWLYGVAINIAREQARARRRMWGDGDASAALSESPDPAADPDRRETLKDLQRALVALPLRQREVVVLRLLEGFDTAETAAIIGCREGTVKAHLHRATQTLRGMLADPT